MQTATPVASTTTAVGVRYGILLGFSWLIIDFILRQFSLGFLSYSLVTSAAAIIISVVLIVLAHRAFKQANGGLMSYGRGFLIAFIMMLIWGMCSALFNYVYVHYIDPEFVDNLRDEMVDFMERNRVPEVEIEKGTARFEEMKGDFSKSLISGLTSGLSFGAVLGLLISIFTKRNQPEFE